MTVVVRELTPADSVRWDEYVGAHSEATFFHRAGWASVIEQAFGHRPHFLLAETGGRVVGVLPLAHQRSLLFGNALISTPFCVYGGVIANDPQAAEALLCAAVQLARELGVEYLELRNLRPGPARFATKTLYVTFRKEILSTDEANLAAIPRKQRAMVRKGIDAGLAASVDEKTGRFYAAYSESVRNLGTPVFARSYFDILKQTFAQDCEILTITGAGGAVVASVMSFYFRDEVLPYYGGGTTLARAVKGNDFMYWELMCRARARGVRIFDYGRSKHDSGSYDFKVHWGFKPEPLHYQYDLIRARQLPDLSPNNRRYRFFIEAWRRLPLGLTRVVGPLLARGLG
jgi:FemAB-related protein (PEP-CTERM system-associated)